MFLVTGAHGVFGDKSSKQPDSSLTHPRVWLPVWRGCPRCNAFTRETRIRDPESGEARRPQRKAKWRTFAARPPRLQRPRPPPLLPPDSGLCTRLDSRRPRSTVPLSDPRCRQPRPPSAHASRISCPTACQIAPPKAGIKSALGKPHSPFLTPESATVFNNWIAFWVSFNFTEFRPRRENTRRNFEIAV